MSIMSDNPIINYCPGAIILTLLLTTFLCQGANTFGALQRRDSLTNYLERSEGDGHTIVFTPVTPQMRQKMRTQKDLLGHIAASLGGELQLSIARHGRGLALHNHAESWQVRRLSLTLIVIFGNVTLTSL